MLEVPLSELETRRLMMDSLSVAAVNAPSRCVVSGPTEAVARLDRELDAKGLPYRRLHTSHAFHSSMMDTILEAFRAQVESVTLQPPHIPYVSNVTGTWMRAADAIDADYWVRHLRHTVRFAAGMDEVLHDPERLLLEVGPGRTLTTLVQSHPKRGAERAMLTSLPPAGPEPPESECLLQTVGRLWLAGVPLDWPGFYAHEQRQRTPLPTYPFERQRYWVEAPQWAPENAIETMAPAAVWHKKPDVADWFYIPSWKRSIASALQPDDPSVTSVAADREAACCLLFINSHGLGPALAQRLEQEGQAVVTVTAGSKFSQLGPDAYTLNPTAPADYQTLLESLRERHPLPGTIVHLWPSLTCGRHSSWRSRIDQGTHRRCRASQLEPA
jgi:acyl transferase domain-containing protein